jgi:hypothetical protein
VRKLLPGALACAFLATTLQPASADVVGFDSITGADLLITPGTDRTHVGMGFNLSPTGPLAFSQLYVVLASATTADDLDTRINVAFWAPPKPGRHRLEPGLLQSARDPFVHDGATVLTRLRIRID